ncbi:MAG: amidohydrolase family protein [Coriobacteriia bacterium]|nr:amidohydrolase family protein [Coriobacteriia bacterium]
MTSRIIIDTHAHVFPPKVVDVAIEALSVPERRNQIGGTLDDLLANMKRAGIKQTWTIPVATRPDQVANINRFAASQRALPGSPIVPLGAIHPDCDNPRAILAEFQELGLPGFKVHPDYQDVHPTDPRMQPIFDAAVDFNLMAYCHSGDDVGPRTALGSPQEYAAVIVEYPDLRIVLAHLGGYLMWDEVEEHLVGIGHPDRVFFDTSHIRGRIGEKQLLRIMRAQGLDRILFGSDSPWMQVADDITYFESLGFAEADLDALFHQNATKLLASTAVS